MLYKGVQEIVMGKKTKHIERHEKSKWRKETETAIQDRGKELGVNFLLNWFSHLSFLI